MSIWEGKDGYISNEYYIKQTNLALGGKTKLLERDTKMPPDNPAVLWLLNELIGSDRSILDFGCGYGRWAEILKGRYYQYVGIDPMKDRLQWAQERFSSPARSFRFVQMDGEFDLGYTFDNVLCLMVLQHLTMGDAIIALKNIATHLSDTGLAYLWEGALVDCSEEEADFNYANSDCPAHMISKPIGKLQEMVPELEWYPVLISEHFAVNKGVRFKLKKKIMDDSLEGSHESEQL